MMLTCASVVRMGEFLTRLRCVPLSHRLRITELRVLPSRWVDRSTLPETRLSGFDPTKPLGGWRTAWRKLTTKAGLPGLRFHDLRHHSITELAESGTSEQTIKAIAGHVSQRMLDRYSHIRLEAKRNALQGPLPQGLRHN